jgi:capsule polysaccharide export protein KpsE/RkpR
MKAEEAMKGFQEKTGALQVEEQAKAVIEGIANLRAQIVAKEVEITVMKTYSTPNNPDLQKAEETLKGFKNELNKLEGKSGSGHDPLMPTGRMPEVGIEYARKLRELKFNEALFELLFKQYEVAKLDEANEAAIIQVIDKAVPPEKKAKPKTLLLVAIATFAGFFFSIFAAFVKEYKEKAVLDPENKDKFETLKKYTAFKLRK